MVANQHCWQAPSIPAGSKRPISQHKTAFFWNKITVFRSKTQYLALLGPFVALLDQFLSLVGQFHKKIKINTLAGSVPLWNCWQAPEGILQPGSSPKELWANICRKMLEWSGEQVFSIHCTRRRTMNLIFANTTLKQNMNSPKTKYSNMNSPKTKYSNLLAKAHVES